jgi:hypothetical protein
MGGVLGCAKIARPMHNRRFLWLGPATSPRGLLCDLTAVPNDARPVGADLSFRIRRDLVRRGTAIRTCVALKSMIRWIRKRAMCSSMPDLHNAGYLAVKVN